MDKFCLRWNDFEENIRHSFKSLRNEEKLFDVTLATDDGQQLQAHKVILCAGSDFFSDIFTKCSQNNMLIYLKGIKRNEIENVIEFLYNGETFVTQEKLSAFLEITQELKVEGLQSDEENIEDSQPKQETSEGNYEFRLNVPAKTTDSTNGEVIASEFKVQKIYKE